MKSVETKTPPKHIEKAIEYAHLKLGNTLEDYIIEAVEKNGYETIVIWGVQGSGKSNRALQIAFWIYRHLSKTDEEAWLKVLDSIIFKPATLVERLEAVPDDERIPCIVWDDVGVHYPSSKFKTDIKEYEAVDEVWAAIRTKVAVIILTIPLIDRLAKNLKDNVTFEIYLGRNQKEIIKRWFYLPGTRDREANFFKLNVEWPGLFDIYFVPKWVWDEYWSMRLRLTGEAVGMLRRVTDMDEEGYTPILDAVEVLKISPNTLQQMVSRGVVRGRKIGGLLHVFEEDIERIKNLEAVKGRARQ